MMTRVDFPAINHKGCTARVEFDERDNIFVGLVMCPHTTISCHGKKMPELHQAFPAAIDDFLLP